MENQLTPVDSSLPVTVANLTGYHARASRIIRPTEEVRKAAENRPYADLQQEIASLNAEQLPDIVEAFLRTNWPMLGDPSLEVNFSVTDQDDPEEGRRFERMIERNKRLGFDQQAGSVLPATFEQFVGVRGIFRTLHHAGLLHPHTLIADQYLPHFMVTAPVWYVSSKRHEMPDNTNTPDPHPDDFVRFMANRLGTARASNWFQMWNRRSRSFAQYKGDIMPSGLMDMIEETLEILDYVVIATPYHDVASKEWADPVWQRLIDPYLIGFSERITTGFLFLGRWSDTGIFPLASEMTAHTMAFLRDHKEKLSGFGHNPYWAFPGDDDPNACLNGAGNALINLANEAMGAFEEDRLFEWLSEGRPTVAERLQQMTKI